MHTITITLSPAAQSAAILAGQDARKEQTWELPVELLPRALALNPTIQPDGMIRLADSNWLPVRPDDAGAALSALESMRAAVVKERERKEAERIEAARSALERTLAQDPADPAAQNHLYLPDMDYLTAEQRSAHSAWVATREAAREARQEKQREESRAMVAAIEAWGRGEVEEIPRVDACAYRDEMRSARAARRLRSLAEVVREIGPVHAIDRIYAGARPLGLLPEEEALEIARAGLLPLDKLQAFIPIAEDEVREHCLCDSDGFAGSVSYRVLTAEEAGGLTRAEWSAVKATRVRLGELGLPAGEIQVHVGECDCPSCPGKPVRKVGILVEVVVGDVTVSREYGIGI